MGRAEHGGTRGVLSRTAIEIAMICWPGLLGLAWPTRASIEALEKLLLTGSSVGMFIMNHTLNRRCQSEHE